MDITSGLASLLTGCRGEEALRDGGAPCGRKPRPGSLCEQEPCLGTVTQARKSLTGGVYLFCQPSSAN